MKKQTFVLIAVFAVILLLSVSIVSASLGDFLKKLFGVKDSSITGQVTSLPSPSPSPTASPCVGKWRCTDWSVCINGKQSRTCTNTCPDYPGKPETTRTCCVENGLCFINYGKTTTLIIDGIEHTANINFIDPAEVRIILDNESSNSLLEGETYFFDDIKVSVDDIKVSVDDIVCSSYVGSKCYVKLRFSKEGKIVLLSPNGGEKWRVGEIHNILWDSPQFKEVNIYLIDGSQKNIECTTNGMCCQICSNWIPISLKKDVSIGKYYWLIPPIIPESYKYKIMARAVTDNCFSNCIADSSDNYFSIMRSSEAICTDSDGGKNYYVKGTATRTHITYPEEGYEGGEFGDKCVDTKTLEEFFCEGGGDNDALSVTYQCPYGCKDGACVNEGPIPSKPNSSCTDGQCTIYEGDTATTIFNSKRYNVTIAFISATQVVLNINGELTTSLSEGETRVLSDKTEVAIEDIVARDVVGNLAYVKLTLTRPTEYGCEVGCYLDGRCLPYGYRTRTESKFTENLTETPPTAGGGGGPVTPLSAGGGGGSAIKKYVYCDIDGRFKEQKEKQEICDNSYECRSNVCASDECVSGSLIQRIIEFFKRLFKRK